MRQDELVGEIMIVGTDQPWLHGRFTAGPAFRDLEPLFQEELALIDHLEEEYERWETLYERIARQLRLIAPTGPVPEFLLHVQGDHAWFRWSEERTMQSRRRCP
ncbi:hypothetical protein [Nonomuraea sp. NPDC048916]|uniref:hypothetical protein n=1 Tax=Nonomuraea sp. NPDC048916 TaxID=3154232 RepID=UPI00340DA455